MITIKTPEEIKLLKHAGSIVYDTHKYLQKYLKPGISALELDKLAYDYIISRGATPSFLNYDGFPNTLCISINDEVVHGIPSNRKLQKGDIVSIDIGACYKGYHGDSAWTYYIGNNPSDDVKRLMEGTKASLYAGLNMIKPGNRIYDISKAIEETAKLYNLSIVRELVGHGVGTSVHEEPDVPNYITNYKGPVLKEGMVLAVEPMLNLGRRNVFLSDNDWTVITVDHKPSAHYEHTIVVTKDGYEILTGEWV